MAFTGGSNLNNISENSGSGIMFNPSNITLDAGSRVRVSQITTLADLKILNQDDILLTENHGSGSGLYENNTYLMNVNPGEYRIKCSKHYFPYFAGKSQSVEMTFDSFHEEIGVTKRVGYFSSNSIAPYNSDLDGFFIESDGSEKYLVVCNSGTEKYRINLKNCEGYSNIINYDWSKFTVIYFDFLWLGGAVLRLFVKTNKGFSLIHSYHYSGTQTGTFTKSPNHKVRYEIRSTTGSGSLRYVCSQVSTEGSFSENGKQRSINSGSSGINLSTIGTTYPILSIRKNELYRDETIKTLGIGLFISSRDDYVRATLHLNPTLTAPLTYNALSNSACEYAIGDGVIETTGEGSILWSNFSVQNSINPPNILDNDFLSILGMNLNNESDELVLCATPLSTNINVYGIMNIKEY